MVDERLMKDLPGCEQHRRWRSHGHVEHDNPCPIQGGHCTFHWTSLPVCFYHLTDLETRLTMSLTRIRWVDVYSFIESKGLVVSGGRLAPIGVPGLLLGGGISFYGNQYGFSCDNVINYEIVLADGSVQNANAKSNSDLYWALKGGSSNFGIVTRFDVQTFKSPKIWAGIYVVVEQYIPQFIAAIANYSASGINDPLSGLVPAVVSGSPNLGVAIIFYDSATQSYPDCFKPFTDIPSIKNSLAFKTLTQFTEETGALVAPAVKYVPALATKVQRRHR